jgi:hypothetical protein
VSGGTGDAEAAAALRIRNLLWLWTITIVGFFSLSEAKQDLYIFPIVPAVAALAATFVSRALDGRASALADWLRGTETAIGALVAAAGAGTLYIFHSAGKIYALDGAALVGWTGTIGGLLILSLALGRRLLGSLIAIAATAIVLNWTFVLIVLPSFERYKPVPAFAAILQQRAGPDDVIAHYNVALPSMVYYLRRHVDVLFLPEPIIERLRGPRTAYAVMSDDDYARLAPHIGVPTCVIGRQPTVNVKLKSVLAREPLPEVLLITNRCGA